MKKYKSIVLCGIAALLCLVLLASCQKKAVELPQHVIDVMQKSVVPLAENSVVGISRGEDHEKVTAAAIENAGGLSEIIKPGNTVLIKPNLCTIAEVDSALTTDYRVVQKVADLARECGASRIIVADGGIRGDTMTASLNTGKYGTITGVETLDLSSTHIKQCYELKPGISLTGRSLFVPKVYMDADVVITVAKLKTHYQPAAVVSLGLKNVIGVAPSTIYSTAGFRDGVHALGLTEVILDLNRIRKPDFTVIDGIIGGEGYGPLECTPVKSNIVLAGKDIVAVDTVALNFMGFKTEDVAHVIYAGNQKLGVTDLAKIKIVGAELESIKMKFKSPFE